MAFHREDIRSLLKVLDFRGNFKAVMISWGRWSVKNALAMCFGGALQKLLNHNKMDGKEALKISINRVCIRLEQSNGTVSMLLIHINYRFSINALLVILQIHLPDGKLLDIQQDVTAMVNLLGVGVILSM